MKLNYKRKTTHPPPLRFTICETDTITILDSMMIVKTSFYNIVLELSPRVINKILRKAQASGIIDLGQIQRHRRKEAV